MSTNIKKQLIEHLEKGKNWERMKTPIDGLYIVKAPQTRNHKAQLFLELNPDDKWKGFFINTNDLLEDVVSILTDERTQTLVNHIEDINPESPRYKPKRIEF